MSSMVELAPEAAVVARERQWLLPVYARTDFHPVKGKGARLHDAAGRAYWDLLGGIAVNVLGYGDPALARALSRAAKGPWHVSNLFYHPAQGLLAERLVALSGLSRAFFCNSGTEATEAALKLARLRAPGRAHVVALQESFHGRTIGALSITGHEAYRAPFLPLLPDVTFVAPNDGDALRAAVRQTTSAIVMEPIMGEAGVIPLDASFLRAARHLADETGATLVFDEVQCGLGRTGSMFAFQEAGVVPDILTLAKPLGGGLPLGAVLAGPSLATVVAPGHHGTTFGGNPLACQLGLAVLQAIEERGLLARVRDLGDWLGRKLARLAADERSLVAVRGRGLMWGLELDREAGPVARRLLDAGYVVGTARKNVLRLLPPYVVPRSALRAFLITLKEVLSFR